MTAKDYHYILGVSKDSSPDAIKAAYIKLALKFHPDKNAGDKYFEDRFKDVQEAYEALINNPSKEEFADKGFEEGKKSADFNSVYPPSIEYFAIDKKRANPGDRIHLRWKVWHADIIQISCLEDLQSNIGSANFQIPKDGGETHFNVDLLAMNSITGCHDTRKIKIEFLESAFNKKSNAPKDEQVDSEKIMNKSSIPKGDSNEVNNADGALGKPATKRRGSAWIAPSAIAVIMIGLIFGLGWWLTGSTSYGENKNDLKERNLHGKVKTLIETEYNIKDGDLSDKKNWDLRSKNVIRFDDEGFEIETTIYYKDFVWNTGNFELVREDYKIAYTTDDNKNMIEKILYTSKGYIDARITYTYDDEGNLIEENYYDTWGSDIADSLIYKHSYLYDDKGNMIEQKTFENFREYNGYKGELTMTDRYFYDDKGKIIEEHWYFENGGIGSEFTYMYSDYDIESNWLKRIRFQDDKPDVLTERIIEY